MFFLFSWKSAPALPPPPPWKEPRAAGTKLARSPLATSGDASRAPARSNAICTRCAESTQGQPHLPAPALPPRRLTLRRGAGSRRGGTLQASGATLARPQSGGWRSPPRKGARARPRHTRPPAATARARAPLRPAAARGGAARPRGDLPPHPGHLLRPRPRAPRPRPAQAGITFSGLPGAPPARPHLPVPHPLPPGCLTDPSPLD